MINVGNQAENKPKVVQRPASTRHSFKSNPAHLQSMDNNSTKPSRGATPKAMY